MSEQYQLFLFLSFPLIFIIHAAEEILVETRWMRSHKESLSAKFPKLRTVFEKISKLNTQAFIIAAFEELLVIALCQAGILVDSLFSYEIWACVYLAFTTHLLTHYGQSLLVRGYVPGLVTSILLLPYSYFGIKCLWLYFGTWKLMLFVLLGVAITMVNLRVGHWAGRRLSNSL